MTFNYDEYRDIIDDVCEVEDYDILDKLTGKTKIDLDEKAGLGQEINFFNDGSNTYFEICGAYMNMGMMVIYDKLFSDAEYKSIADNMVRESIEGLND